MGGTRRVNTYGNEKRELCQSRTGSTNVEIKGMYIKKVDHYYVWYV